MYGTNMHVVGILCPESAGTVLAGIGIIVRQVFAFNVCCGILTTSVHGVADQAFPLVSAFTEATGNVFLTLGVVICNFYGFIFQRFWPVCVLLYD